MTLPLTTAIHEARTVLDLDPLEAWDGNDGELEALRDALEALLEAARGHLIHPALGATVKVSSDAAKRDPELHCDTCEAILCDIEHDDTLDVLFAVAQTHTCTTVEELS